MAEYCFLANNQLPVNSVGVNCYYSMVGKLDHVELVAPHLIHMGPSLPR